MRLTLRTLLAYLDDLLDRKDADELESKIQSSPLASELVHRIRNTVGQIRLDAPGVDGTGMGGDPNTVAEYLDNTLPPERVPDFERVCLDSDVHLGEVAACHQVLTLVLGEPADVSPAMRRRVYAIGREDEGDVDVLAAEPHEASLGSTQLPVTAVSTAPIDSSEPIVERNPAADDAPDERWTQPTDKRDYTDRTPVRWIPLALTALVAFVLVFLGLRNLGPFDSSHPVAQMFGSGAQIADASGNDNQTSDPDSGSDLPPATGTAAAEPDIDGEADGPAEMEDDDHATIQTDTPEDFAATDDVNAELEAQARTDDDPIADDPIDDFPDTETIEDGFVPNGVVGELDDTGQIVSREPEFYEPNTTESNPLPGENELAIGNPSRTASAIVPPEPRPLADPIANRIRNSDASSGEAALPFPGAVESNTPAVDNTDSAVADDAPFDPVMEGGPVDPEGPVELGRLMAEEDVALRMNPATQTWERPQVGTVLTAGDEYFSLPVFRPRLLMTNGAQVTLVGATSVRFLDPQRSGVPHLRLNYGRLLVLPNNDQGLDLDLQVGNRNAQLLFDDATSAAAIEVRQEHIPGSDPTAEPPHIVVEVYATSGNVHWVETNQEPVQVAAGQRLAFVNDQAGDVTEVTATPWWIDQEFASPHNRQAMMRLGPKISSDRPAVVSLQEQSEPSNRLLEVRSLAVCSLAYLGDVRPLVAALNDDSLKAYREEQVQALKNVVDSDPAMAAEVRNALEMRHGERADELFRMLWGYSPDQLQAGADQQLVDYLQDESLDFRIVAIETLKDIVGKSGTKFIPEQTESRRRRGAVYWQKEAENGRIRYKETPDILNLTSP